MNSSLLKIYQKLITIIPPEDAFNVILVYQDARPAFYYNNELDPKSYKKFLLMLDALGLHHLEDTFYDHPRHQAGTLIITKKPSPSPNSFRTDHQFGQILGFTCPGELMSGIWIVSYSLQIQRKKNQEFYVEICNEDQRPKFEKKRQLFDEIAKQLGFRVILSVKRRYLVSQLVSLLKNTVPIDQNALEQLANWFGNFSLEYSESLIYSLVKKHKTNNYRLHVQHYIPIWLVFLAFCATAPLQEVQADAIFWENILIPNLVDWEKQCYKNIE